MFRVGFGRYRARVVIWDKFSWWIVVYGELVVTNVEYRMHWLRKLNLTLVTTKHRLWKHNLIKQLTEAFKSKCWLWHFDLFPRQNIYNRFHDQIATFPVSSGIAFSTRNASDFRQVNPLRNNIENKSLPQAIENISTKLFSISNFIPFFISRRIFHQTPKDDRKDVSGIC